MGDERHIKRLFVSDGKLNVLCNGGIQRLRSNGGEPNTWPIERFANIGAAEPFMACFTGELLELVNFRVANYAERETIKESILTLLMEGLMPAFEHLKKIRVASSQALPRLNRMQLFEDFSRVLWHAYKDLFPRAVKLMGFDIGFVFQNQKTFNLGAVRFIEAHPNLMVPDLPAYFLRQRDTWQNGLSDFRNHFLEHRSQERSKFASYYEAPHAEELFSVVWQVIANTLIVLAESQFPPGITVQIATEEEGWRYRAIFSRSPAPVASTKRPD